MFLPQLQRGPNAFFEKIPVYLCSLRSHHPDIDFGFRVIKPNPKEALAMVLHLHNVTILRRRREPQHRPAVNPRMSCQNTIRFSRTQKHNRQRVFHKFVNSSAENVAEKARTAKDIS
jgi:hypothetical protein